MASNEEQYTFTPDDLDRFMEVAVKLVHEAGEMIKASLGKTKAVNLKDETCIEVSAHLILRHEIDLDNIISGQCLQCSD